MVSGNGTTSKNTQLRVDKSNKERIIFIAVNYNSAKHTLKYIESVNELTLNDKIIEIIIIDNHSELEDYLIIKNATKKAMNVKLIKNNENVGYFKGLNVGISSVVSKKNSVLIIGNNDIEFRKDFLISLNKIEYDCKTLILAPNVITKNGFHQNPHSIKKVTTFRKIGYKIYYKNYYIGRLLYWLMQQFKKVKHTKIYNEYNQEQFIHMGIGACYVLTEHFFNFFSKIDDRVFLWGEEALLAGQIATVGGRMLYNPNIVVYHDENVSISKLPTRQVYNITKQSYKIYSKYL
jgi:GT2 family glycosyltransferase